MEKQVQNSRHFYPEFWLLSMLKFINNGGRELTSRAAVKIIPSKTIALLICCLHNLELPCVIQVDI
jgi:hypothetical protein